MKTLGFVCMALLALGVAAYAFVGYGALPLGSLVHPDMKSSFEANRVAVYAHVFAAGLALALGPLQFWQGLRSSLPRVHRVLGRVYLAVGISVGGVSALYLAPFAYGGVVAKLGFGSLAVIWLWTGWRAFQSIRRGDVSAHREWITRNFALTLAAVTLRIYIPTSMAAGIAFDLAYPAIAWLCWVPNLLLAEWLIRRSLTSNFDHALDPFAADPARRS